MRQLQLVEAFGKSLRQLLGYHRSSHLGMRDSQ